MSESQDTRGLPYVPALDGVRAIAVTAVLLYHGDQSWLPGGFLGVDVFFVLSGFLITSLLLTELRATGAISLPQFWLRRARRLLPAAFLVIGVSMLVAAIFVPSDAARTRGDGLWSLLYLNNWHQILADQSYFATFGRPSLLEHLWSLAVEEQFYLLWPPLLTFVIARFGRGAAVGTAVGLGLVSAVLAAALFDPAGDATRVYFGTDTHATGLLIGATLAFAWPVGRLRDAPGTRAPRVLDALAVIALLAVLAFMIGVHDYDAFTFQGGTALAAAFTALLLATVVHPSCQIGSWLGREPLNWIGRRSYGIYLWHWPVMAMSRPELDVDLPTAVLVPLQIALAVGLAALSYKYVEMPVRTGAARAWLDARAPRLRLATVLGAMGVIVLIGVIVGTVKAPPPPLRVTQSAAATEPINAPVVRGRPLAVGASVMLGAEPVLGKFARVDAKVGRQIDDIIARIESYKDADRLPSQVIVQVGENGPIDAADLERLRDDLFGVARIVLVNVNVPRSWGDESNRVIAAAAGTWRQARVADWSDASRGKGLLFDDATHPTRKGAKVYARVIEEALSAR